MAVRACYIKGFQQGRKGMGLKGNGLTRKGKRPSPASTPGAIDALAIPTKTPTSNGLAFLHRRQTMRTISPEAMATVKATAPALEKHGVAITTAMYARLFQNAEIEAMFDRAAQDSGEQPLRELPPRSEVGPDDERTAGDHREHQDATHGARSTTVVRAAAATMAACRSLGRTPCERGERGRRGSSG